MWTDENGPFRDLRQGDLLGPVLLPRQLAVPLRVATVLGATHQAGDPVLVNLDRCEYFLVVSQCCTLENDRVAALAPLKKTKPLPESQQQAYLVDQPTEDGGAGYIVQQHRIDVWGEFDDLRPGQFLAATFTQIQTYAGDLSMLAGLVVRRMTPEGRESLRRRLSIFWGRAEASDNEYLQKRAEPNRLDIERAGALDTVTLDTSV